MTPHSSNWQRRHEATMVFSSHNYGEGTWLAIPSQVQTSLITAEPTLHSVAFWHIGHRKILSALIGSSDNQHSIFHRNAKRNGTVRPGAEKPTAQALSESPSNIVTMYIIRHGGHPDGSTT